MGVVLLVQADFTRSDDPGSSGGSSLWIDLSPRGALFVSYPASSDVTAGGQVAVKRSDIYNGRPIAFVPFTKLQGDVIKGTH